jgi:hypothetical protein
MIRVLPRDCLAAKCSWIGDRRLATGDWRPATGDRRPATGDRRLATGDRRPATGDRWTNGSMRCRRRRPTS